MVGYHGAEGTVISWYYSSTDAMPILIDAPAQVADYRVNVKPSAELLTSYNRRLRTSDLRLG